MCDNCIDIEEDAIDTEYGTYFIRVPIHRGCILCAAELIQELFSGVVIREEEEDFNQVKKAT
jgi:hypothetical protein